MFRQKITQSLKETYENCRQILENNVNFTETSTKSASMLESLHTLVTNESLTTSDILNMALEARDNKFDLNELYKISLQIAPHYQAPPEYDDLTGQDPNCIPGYYFSCPDVETIMKSVLYQNIKVRATIRCPPPNISYIINKNNTNTYVLIIETEHKNASIKYAIDSSQYELYDPTNPPILSAGKEYDISAYCIATNYLPSNIEYKLLRLSAKIDETKTIATESVEDSNYNMPSLFIESESEDEDSFDDL